MTSIKHKLGVIGTELAWVAQPRLALLSVFLKLFPTGFAGRLRAAAYRSLGWRIGTKTLVMGPVTFSSPQMSRRHLTIGERCFVNAYVHIDTSAAVTIGEGVSIGHHAVIITADHEVGPPESRAGALTPRPVAIGDGAWIAARVTILPGVTIGEGAVVAAGAVVKHDVPAHCLVAGVPARVVRELPSNVEDQIGVRV